MYWVYLLRCADGSLYAGITTDPERRLRQHRGERPGGRNTPRPIRRRPLRLCGRRRTGRRPPGWNTGSSV
jgi:putative endonuclease